MNYDTCKQWYGYLKTAVSDPDILDMKSYQTTTGNRRWKLVVLDSLGNFHDIKTPVKAAEIRNRLLSGDF